MSRRRVIEIPGVNHGEQPFPMAVRAGSLLVSSGVHGMDASTSQIPDDPDQQIANMFDNIQVLLEAAGGSVDDIVQILLTLTDRSLRVAVNEHWVRLFPDPADRPTRNTQFRELGGNSVCSALVTAVLDD